MGFRAERTVVNGREIWTIIDLGTQRVIATGDTLSEAVNSFESETETEQ